MRKQRSKNWRWRDSARRNPPGIDDAAAAPRTGLGGQVQWPWQRRHGLCQKCFGAAPHHAGSFPFCPPTIRAGAAAITPAQSAPSRPREAMTTTEPPETVTTQADTQSAPTGWADELAASAPGDDYSFFAASGGIPPTELADPANGAPAQWRTRIDWDEVGEPPDPRWLTLDDGRSLIYPGGEIAAMFSAPSAGKTWLVHMLIYDALTKQDRVLLWDWEMSLPRHKQRIMMLDGRRLLNLWADPNLMAYVDSTQLYGGEGEKLDAAVGWLTGGDGYGLVIIDTASAAGNTHHGAAETYQWLDEHVRPWTAAGITVVMCGHVAKGHFTGASESQATQYGSVANLNDPTHAFYLEGPCWSDSGNGAHPDHGD